MEPSVGLPGYVLNTLAIEIEPRSASNAPIVKEHAFPLDIKSVWEGMEECQNLGLTKAIGVSNFSCKKLEELLSCAKIPPADNQVEMNPLWQQKKLREFCKAKDIHITAFSPLGANGTMWGDNRIVECDVLEEIAKAHGKTAAQISLRWIYEQGVSLVTKSYNKERMKQNLEIFDWSLTEEESNKIDQLPQRKGVTFASLLGPHDLMLELDAET
uniref:NADP-dependent oxidoreductase domain-containing protein n=1 Tax=Fagus sylvatica TaxID=28930 RepID=A0A2N9EHQ5_FAGSY